jgi:UDP-N-acetylmuramoyl-tripeptide--D-alanyl-D-alanine ligase
MASALEAVDPGSGRLQKRQIGSLSVLCDYYNASPASMKMSLEILRAQIKNSRRIAILGDMLELGSQEVPAHQEVGLFASRYADVVLAVGPRAKQIAQAANLERMGCATWTGELEDAWQWMRANVKPGDVVLLKASHGMNFHDLYQKIERWGGPQ